jgi:hypothetical protein
MFCTEDPAVVRNFVQLISKFSHFPQSVWGSGWHFCKLLTWKWNACGKVLYICHYRKSNLQFCPHLHRYIFLSLILSYPYVITWTVDGVPLIIVNCNLGYWYKVWLILNCYTSNICRDSNSCWDVVDWMGHWGLLWCNIRGCIGKLSMFNKTLPFWEDSLAGNWFCSYWYF